MNDFFVNKGFIELGDVSLAEKVDFMTTLAFYSGIIIFSIGLFRLGWISKLLPDTLTTSFTCGVSFHVVTSQLFHVFGINKQATDSPFGLFKQLGQLISEIPTTNIPAISTSIPAIIFMLTMKYYSEFVFLKIKTSPK